MNGVFYGIGVGPGDPDLLTMKAVQTLQKIDVIIAPKTEKKDGSVALTIAGPHIKKETEIVYQVFPMVKNFAEHPEAWEENKKEILSLLQAGKNVAFLTLGDPMFFSTYIYVYRLLKKENIKIETIPGIPAFLGIGSAIGYPVVEGDDILSVIPATASKEKIAKALQASDNAVIMKVYKNFSEITETLIEQDMAKSAMLVSRVGLDDEVRIEDLEAHKDEKINYLSTILTRKN